jgi:hypothetical protein
LTIDEVEDLGTQEYNDLVRRCIDIYTALERKIGKMHHEEKVTQAARLEERGLEDERKAARNCARRLSADIDGVLRSFEKAAKEEAQLCGGVSREKVDIPKRFEEMKFFCENRIALAAEKEEESEEEEEEERLWDQKDDEVVDDIDVVVVGGDEREGVQEERDEQHDPPPLTSAQVTKMESLHLPLEKRQSIVEEIDVLLQTEK